jgi:hypothetical protein
MQNIFEKQSTVFNDTVTHSLDGKNHGGIKVGAQVENSPNAKSQLSLVAVGVRYVGKGVDTEFLS